MAMDLRSGCPINLSLEVFGDRWSLIILRDIIFGGRRHFRELLNGSIEGIASNILADRLKRLVELGMLTKADDPTHKQKAIYSLTEMSITLIPILAQLGAWGRVWLPVSEELSIRAKILEEGGMALWQDFMDELRCEHLGIGTPKPVDATVRARLQAAYQAVVDAQLRKAS
ncbi:MULTISPECIES: winged helix-turn-helix transcriptional regulator [Phyllobacteriaceae]|jgi:DNA-binding HxlR family transcriptional regulator|uniref:MarR family transcriptional regulator n=2 Tax=Pseudomonadota TaxID=1224 RepID=A0A1C2DFI9_9HYPH|nr:MULTISPECIES: helix-turn-helix domain-containing protein [Mesorhizobium]MBN9232291.1 helix-turn-helix transcriptional regulator [Mesorhizobium sp.]MDQ0329887.1 DNA-binding HxlR family transcriptional regulator [Mesorhizobium sp. YL-MeA3-2017]OCX13539.1 MarR family transcriptional regulator [Mesorhizobium hungaricum]